MIPPVEGQLTVRVAPTARIRWIEVEGRWAGKQTRAAVAQAEFETPGFVIANLRGSVRVAGADLVPGVENLFNKTYRNHLDPVRLARPGRNSYLKMQRAF
jgi:outer membrane receptor protein involved in Fe transport